MSPTVVPLSARLTCSILSSQCGNCRPGGGWGGDQTRWTGPYALNATVTKLMGEHSIKAGADMRKLGINVTAELSPDSGELYLGGTYSFNSLFTSRNGAGGHEFASLLLGLPVDGGVPFNPLD